MTIENINTREQYLNWVAEWKQDYETLSKEIVGLKTFIKNESRAGGYAGREQNALRAKQFTATAALEQRKAAKEYAAALRAASLQDAT